MSVKEKAVRIATQMKSTNIVFAAFLIIAGFALISMPQIIGPANAQSDEASEHACPVPGYTLSRGECTAEPTTTRPTCQPSTVAGIPVRQISSTTCIVGGPESVITSEVCDAIEEGVRTVPTPGLATCRFPVTDEISCPGGVPPTEEEECITKPGRGNDPT